MDITALRLPENIETIAQQMTKEPGRPISKDQLETLNQTLSLLNSGHIRVSEPKEGKWHVNIWVKQALTCYLHYMKTTTISDHILTYQDKVRPKYSRHSPPPKDIRIVPPAHIRFGAYIGPHSIIMPSFINIGAHVGAHSLIDSFATIGSGAQIGSHVHISGGSGIAGVLEPIQSRPTIIEDHCFIGARCEVSEGVIIKQGAVLATGTFLSGSTRIYDRTTQQLHQGVVPENAVVVPGSIPSHDGTHSIYACIIVKYADSQTRGKTALNDYLRS